MTTAFRNKGFCSYLSILAVSIFLTVLTVNMAQNSEIIIESQEDLDLIGATNNCSYFENYEDICKDSPAHPGSPGYWSSCKVFACEIAIPVGRIQNQGDLPTQVRVVSYIIETGAEIRLRYRLSSSDITINLNPPVPGSRDWTVSQMYNLEDIPGFNSESEIILRLTSYPFDYDSDILDKIIFTFGKSTEKPTSYPPNPTTYRPTNPTTVNPPNPTTANPPNPTTVNPPIPTTANPPNPTTVNPPIPTTTNPPNPTTESPAESTTEDPTCYDYAD